MIAHVAQSGEDSGRVVIQIRSRHPSAVAMQAAVQIARAFGSDLESLFVEDTQLFDCAAYGFVREISLSGRETRPLSLDAPAAVIVTADAERVRQVVDNLLANVRAHTPPDAAAVVRVRADGANAVLEIADAGPGLDSERAAHVFERFYRGDPSRSRDHGGAGLGLSIVAAIVQAHGGTVGLESIPGVGTTLRVTLPGREPPALPEGSASSLPSVP